MSLPSKKPEIEPGSAITDEGFGRSTPTASQFSESGANRNRVSRISHACDRCRRMRTKCSGGVRCTKCIKDNATCAYGDRKRERNKKDLAETVERVMSLEEENEALVKALRSLTSSSDFQSEKHEEVMDLLSKYSPHDTPMGSPGLSSRGRGQWSFVSGSSKNTPIRRRQSSFSEGEKSAPSSLGSPGRQGELTRVVDLDEGSGAAGYVGKMSDSSWIRRVREHLFQPLPKSGTEASHARIDSHADTAKEITYFMDEYNLLSVDEDHVDGHQWPPFQVALILSEAFFHSVQGSFQFLIREQFLETMIKFPRSKSIPSWAERRWLSLANLVWAIGSRWLQMTRLDDQSLLDDHLMYYARARALGLDHRILFDHPDIERIQAIGLLSFYLLINGSVSRAWNTLGHAIRHAVALGLHLRVTDPNISAADQVQRAKVWYSLLSLEVLIAEMTGRPKSVSLADVTVPITLLGHSPSTLVSGRGITESTSSTDSKLLWINFLNSRKSSAARPTIENSPSDQLATADDDFSSKQYICHVRLCLISDQVALRLYTGSQDQPWSETQSKISELQTQLRHWVESLPEEFDIQRKPQEHIDSRARIELSLYYHSIQMMLCRPCLCDFQIENQSTKSMEFNRASARACVHAAMSMLATMPENPSASEAYFLLPWWTLLHYVCQATAVLLLELSLGCPHFENELPEVIKYLRKAMAYLWVLASGSISAYKAWRIFCHLVALVGDRYEDLRIDGIPEEAPKPLGWTDANEQALREIID